MTWAYLIHFDSPLAHARHYTGACRSIMHRLHAHAHGQGARILEVLMEHGIEWQLAAVWLPGFSVERLIKVGNNAPRYCPICAGERARKPKGATVFELEKLQRVGFPLRSDEWREFDIKKGRIE